MHYLCRGLTDGSEDYWLIPPALYASRPFNSHVIPTDQKIADADWIISIYVFILRRCTEDMQLLKIIHYEGCCLQARSSV